MISVHSVHCHDRRIIAIPPPGLGAKIQFDLPRCTSNTLSGMFLLLSNSFASYTYLFIKMSDLDAFIGRVSQKHPKNHNFPTDLVQKCNFIYPKAPP